MAESDSKYELISRKEAKENGLRHFFTGEPCKKGHIARRFVCNLDCEICSRERTLAWQNRNPKRKREIGRRSWKKRWPHRREKEIARVIAWHKRNPENVRRASKRFYEKHTDKQRKRSIKWYWANKPRVASAARRRYERDPELAKARQKQWRKENPEKSRALIRNTAARKKKAEGTHAATDVAEIFKQQRGRCAYCRNPFQNDNYTVDHIKPLKLGGRNDRRNLQLACRSCNSRKNAHDPIAFAQTLGMLL